MARKRWRHDGPPHSAEGFKWSREAFQGKAYPNPYNGDLDADQKQADRERERWIAERDKVAEREKRRFDANMAKRRREKKGQS
jgi:hypothetical protein